MTPDLRKLKHLVAVARAGSLSAAAGQLHITQPALSRSISVAEEQLGIQIFERGHQGVEVTGAGKTVIAEAERLLSQARVFSHNLTLCSRAEYGELKFGMWPLLGSMVLSGLCAHFVNTRPQLKMWASVKSASALLRDLYEDKIELFFCGKDHISPSSDLQIEILGEVSLAVLVRTSHPLTRMPAVQQKYLHHFPMLSSVDWSAIPPHFMDAGIVYCDDFEAMRYTMLHSDGIWMAPMPLVTKEIEAGTIKELAIVDEGNNQIDHYSIAVQMVHLKDYKLSPPAAEVEKFVRQYFSPSPKS